MRMALPYNTTNQIECKVMYKNNKDQPETKCDLSLNTYNKTTPVSNYDCIMYIYCLAENN